VITKTDGSNLDANNLTSAEVSSNSLAGLSSGTVVNGALQWGLPNIGLTFSQPITLSIFVGTSLNGQTLNVLRSTSGSSGWTDDGIVSPGTCLVTAGYCTFQATKASVYAATKTTTTSSSSTSSSSSNSSGQVLGTSTSCGDTKPGSAPRLVSALPGFNSVILNWLEGADPISYYLVAYGTSPNSPLFGNPNVGGKGTTKYTVGGLSGNKTYYFKVRSGNGCTPGDFSNELSATPTGAEINQPATGFTPDILGASTEEATPEGEIKGEATVSSDPQIPQETKTSPFYKRAPILILTPILLVLVLGFYYFKKSR
jgi:hypothetical protein